MSSIYRHREKPPLGAPPAYTRMTIDTIPGLTGTDSLILKLCCEPQVQTGNRCALIGPQAIIEQAEAGDIHHDETLETLEVLADGHYIETKTTAEGTIFFLWVTDYGFDSYARTYLPEYDSLFKSVALQIVNHEIRSSEEIA